MDHIDPPMPQIIFFYHRQTMQFWGNSFMLKYALRNLEGGLDMVTIEKNCSNYSYTKSLGHIVPILNRVEEKNV